MEHVLLKLNKPMEDEKNDEKIYLATNVTLMRFAGLWAETPKELLWALLFWCVVLTCIVLQALALQDTMQDMDEFLRVFVTLLPFCLLSCKVAFTVLRRDRVQWLVSDVRYRCRIMAEKFPKEGLRVFAACDQRIRNIIIRFLGLIVVFLVGWLTKPGLVALGVITETVHLPDDKVDLPVKLRFPLDTSYRPYLGLAVLYELLIGVMMALELVLVNVFYVGVVMMLCAQLSVLGKMLSSLNNDNVHETLPFCVDMHNSILRCGMVLEELLSPLLLLQFSFSIGIVCQILIQIAEAPMAFLYMVRYVGFMVVMLSELWLYCSFGSQLIDHSEAVMEAAYSCQWYDMKSTYRKGLSLVSMRSQKPLRLVIGNMYVVSLNTFSEVLKMSYSAFTLIRQLKNQEVEDTHN